MESMRNLHIVLFIGVMCVVQTMALNCPYSDPRCTCSTYSVTCSDLQEIPPLNTGVNVSQIGSLTLERGNITNIPSNSLPPGLISISLFCDQLTNISEDAFDKSAATLQTVHIIGGHLNNLPTALKKLTTLKDLYITDTSIQVWDPATLKQIATTLVNIYLYNVGLSTWPSWISEFDLLYAVDLSSNSLKSIPDNAFMSIEDTLTSLELGDTDLTQVPQALSTLTNLTSLDLSNNNFTNVSEIDKINRSPFAQKLSFLYLDSVGLTRIANFSNLTSLRSLSLSHNGISDVPAGSLPPSLTNLYLSNNKLSTVPKDIAGLSRLSYLELDNNLITDIESNSFPSSLTDLYLSFNHITIITNTSLESLNNLLYLNLAFNPISTISPDAFSDLVSLQYLDILHLHLTEIPLAFTLLSSQVYVSFTTTESLTCPCPASQKLLQWFASLDQFIGGTCSNGQTSDSYLRGQCVQTSFENEETKI